MPVGPDVDSRRAARAVALALLAVVLLPSAPPALGQEHVPRRRLGTDVQGYLPALGDPERREAPPIQNPTGPIALRDAVALALLQHPGLAAFAWETRAREARVLQAGRPPNPTVSVLTEDIGGSGPASSPLGQFVQPQTTIQLGQVVELGGKRVARQQLARLDRDLAGWDYETARIDVLTEVSRTFTDVLAAQETVALTEQSTRLVEQVLQTVGARVVAGVVSPIEETRATVALATVRVEAARARRALDASRTRLALLWGSPTPVFAAVVGDLRAEPAPLPPVSDLAIEMAQSPDLARWAAEISQREGALAVERSKRIPDLSVVGGYRRFTSIDSHAFVVGATVPLPLFDRNRGGIEQARSRLAKAHEERRAVQSRIGGLLADGYAALASAHDEVTALRSAIVPGAQQTFEAVSEGYRLGKFGYLDVLDAQRTFISAGSQYLRALADYQKAVADVERLIGAPLAASLRPPTTAPE